jgi:hypothetical protein
LDDAAEGSSSGRSLLRELLLLLQVGSKAHLPHALATDRCHQRQHLCWSLLFVFVFSFFSQTFVVCSHRVPLRVRAASQEAEAVASSRKCRPSNAATAALLRPCCVSSCTQPKLARILSPRHDCSVSKSKRHRLMRDEPDNRQQLARAPLACLCCCPFPDNTGTKY